ncbi:rCG46073 [Rattus norvegicus]|uniref:RCG46073 n=1 Tax=Rattus norvegicus TaxID=10116 RepID=A6ICF1_RAT|nr:rCG46073 [Rattus norvegicus]
MCALHACLLPSRASDTLERDSWAVASHCMGAGNQTCVFFSKSTKCSELLSHL